MKSFADWTDEIRELMNPPAPMVDTCNFQPTWLTPRFREGLKGQIEWRKELEGTFDLAEDDDYTAVYIMAPQLKIAERWTRDRDLPWHRVHYLYQAQQLRGLARGSKVLSVGNWMSNKTKEQIIMINELIKRYDIKLEFV